MDAERQKVVSVNASEAQQIINYWASSELITNAMHLARFYHRDQKRKYTGDPYFTHLQNVAMYVSTVTADEATIAAAFCHDLLEDTDCVESSMLVWTSPRTVEYVKLLTNPPKSEGNRAHRKAIVRERLKHAPAEVQTLKVADLTDNCRSIVEHDEAFAWTYIDEAVDLLEGLTKADLKLRGALADSLTRSVAELEQRKLDRALDPLKRG